LMILEVFSNLNDSTILWKAGYFLGRHQCPRLSPQSIRSHDKLGLGKAFGVLHPSVTRQSRAPHAREGREGPVPGLRAVQEWLPASPTRAAHRLPSREPAEPLCP